MNNLTDIKCALMVCSAYFNVIDNQFAQHICVCKSQFTNDTKQLNGHSYKTLCIINFKILSFKIHFNRKVNQKANSLKGDQSRQFQQEWVSYTTIGMSRD